MENLDPAVLTGLATLIAASVGFLTWWLTKKENESEAGSRLIGDALALQQAAQDAYNDARQEMQNLKDDALNARADITELRTLIGDIMSELEHWRTIAALAKDDYQKKYGEDPPWFRPFGKEENGGET